MNDNAKKWVEALRSGEFKGTTGQLTRGRGGERRYCCLGVACELYKREHPKFDYSAYDASLPEKVQRWLGLADRMGAYGETSLAKRNDDKAGFKTIAEIIEREPDGLFKEKG